MIESIFIIDIGSGVPLFSFDLLDTEESMDKDMFSGFLKVLNDFSQETRNEQINEIVLASSRFVYEKNLIAERELLLVSIDDQKDRANKIRSVLQKIGSQFGDIYKSEIKNFQGQIDTFKPFEKEVRDIITMELGTFKEKIILKHQDHPIKSFISKFSKESISEFEKNKLNHIRKIKQKEKEIFEKIKGKVVNTFKKEKDT
ncbi:MAG: hypothetical protein ACTSVY_09975 [Candidatus Helarchaeota archaeon]